MHTNGNYSASKSAFKVLVADPIHSCGFEILKSIAEVTAQYSLQEDQLCEIIGEFDGLVVRSSTTVTEAIIKRGKKLKIIGRAGVGVDNIDVAAATRHGVYVVCSPSGNTVSAAEHTFALMLALSRNVTVADASLRAGTWNRSGLMGIQLQRKTLGIIGLGQVGSYVASIAKSFQMNLLSFDPFANEAKAKSVGCKLCSLEELLAESDFVTLHIPLCDETKYLIRKETIALMKHGARIINASRGGVVNEDDLCDALQSSHLGGAALDVFEVEAAIPATSQLRNTPNLILTPHLGASTLEAQINVARDVAEQIQDLFSSRIPLYAVNVPGISSAELKVLHPILSASETLGKIVAQLLQGPLETLTVTVRGAYANQKLEPFLLSAANGVLSFFSSQRVNFVNVRQKADENKIKLQVTKDNENGAASVKVLVSNKKYWASVAGSIVENSLMLNEFQEIPIFMRISSNILQAPTFMLYSKHSDLPGTLGSIATRLGDHNVNVSSCHLGKTEENGFYFGICVFQVDHRIEPNVMKSIESLPRIVELKQFII